MTIWKHIAGRLGVIALAATSATAAADTILFAHVGTATYTTEGNDLASMLSADGHTVDVEYLNLGLLGDLSGYDQIWVYDLQTGANNNGNQVANYSAIANWYNNTLTASEQNLILDGRIISSSDRWTSCVNGISCPGSAMSEEDAWIQNYAHQLSLRGGGLMLGTDHNSFQAGINTINSLIGINPFTGFYASNPVQAVVDPNSPLYLPSLDVCGYNNPDPGGSQCINDNSSTGFVATGLQANGQTLTPVAWHGALTQADANAAVSSTMGSITFGTCGNPGQPPCTVSEPAPLALLSLSLIGLVSRRLRLA